MLSIHQLRLIREVLREGSVSRAAAKLFISQPAVSIQLKRLEDDVGLPLVERLAGQFVPTEAGRRLYALANQVLALLEETQNGLQDLRAGMGGRIRLGSATGVLYYLASVLRLLKEQRPKLEIVLSVSLSEEIAEAIGSNTVDLGVIWIPVPNRSLAIKRLFTAPYAMVVSPRHRLAREKSVTAAMLDGEKFITAVKGSGSHALLVDEVLNRHQVKASVLMEIAHTEAIKQSAGANLGIGIVPRRAAEQELADGGLVVLPLSGISLSRDLALAYREQKLKEPLVSSIASDLVHHLLETSEGGKGIIHTRSPRVRR